MNNIDLSSVSNNVISGIDNIDIITYGTLKEMIQVTNPNQVGKVINNDTMEVMYDINPMIMIINQNKSDYRERLDHLIQNGGDMDKEINYGNRVTTPREIAIKYRKY